jgi:hypothetical protein
MGGAFLGFGLIKVVLPMEHDLVVIGPYGLEASSASGRAVQYGIGLLELALGSALLTRVTRRIGTISAVFFGIACVVNSLLGMLSEPHGGCGCLGRIDIPLSARLLFCGAITLGGVSLLGMVKDPLLARLLPRS